MLTHKQRIILTAYTYRFQICQATLVLSSVYLLFALFQVDVLIAFALLIGSLVGLCYLKWRTLRENGFINYASPKTKDVLLKRSILDIFRDQIYYPYFTKILGLFITAAVTKPSPSELETMIQKLPENIKKVINTKGLLHLAPNKVEQLMLTRQPDVIADFQIQALEKPKLEEIVLPKNYGVVAVDWDRREEYEAEEVKIHDHTISKQMIYKISERLKWQHIISLGIMLTLMLKMTKAKRLQKMFVYNSSFFGIILLAVLVYIKYKQPLRRHMQKLERIGK